MFVVKAECLQLVTDAVTLFTVLPLVERVRRRSAGNTCLLRINYQRFAAKGAPRAISQRQRRHRTGGLDTIQACVVANISGGLC
jgi:hypothetical protein